jgi:hypothetical protein
VARPRPEKKREENKPASARAAEQRVLPMQLQIGDRLVDETGTWEGRESAVHDECREGRPHPHQEGSAGRM